MWKFTWIMSFLACCTLKRLPPPKRECCPVQLRTSGRPVLFFGRIKFSGFVVFQEIVSFSSQSFLSMLRLPWHYFTQRLLELLDRKWQLCSTDPRVILRILMMNITCWPRRASKNRFAPVVGEETVFSLKQKVCPELIGHHDHCSLQQTNPEL